MTKIINLIGASGSGKTTIAYKLKDVNVIESYTTRPKRHTEEKGHIFIDKATDEGNVLQCNTKGYTIDFHKNDIIAHRKYGDNDYWATKQQVKYNKVNVYVVDPEGARQVEDFYKSNPETNIISIFLNVDENIRKDRLVKRYLQANTRAGNINTCLHYKKALEKANKRLERDKQVFKTIKCDYVINNNEKIEDTLKIINKIIQEG